MLLRLTITVGQSDNDDIVRDRTPNAFLILRRSVDELAPWVQTADSVFDYVTDALDLTNPRGPVQMLESMVELVMTSKQVFFINNKKIKDTEMPSSPRFSDYRNRYPNESRSKFCERIWYEILRCVAQRDEQVKTTRETEKQLKAATDVREGMRILQYGISLIGEATSFPEEAETVPLSSVLTRLNIAEREAIALGIFGSLYNMAPTPDNVVPKLRVLLALNKEQEEQEQEQGDDDDDDDDDDDEN
eukprot:GILJ01010639.1.p1 GENE.GILJ01010639.1~~GILJ01010639.1.p1  ORF type:complete len:246 (+),score=47.58 GILJ01010639.1:227-964(+)